MATSGTYTFNENQSQIINDAAQLIGVVGQGRSLSSADTAFALNQLNSMIKAWEAKGIHIWTQTQGVLFVNTLTNKYTLGPDSVDAYAANYDTAVITTTTAQVAAAGTVLPCTSVTGMVNGDYIGIVLATGAIYWSIISSISSLNVTIAGSLPSVASSGAQVYDFTTRINKPMKIHNMRRATGTSSSLSEIPMLELSSNDYFNLPNKNNPGLPTHYFYNPNISDGTLYLWQLPISTVYYFPFTYSRQLQDFTGATQTADLPVEWLETIKWNLAVRLAPAFDRDSKLSGSNIGGVGLKAIADQMLQDMLDFDAETVSVCLQPNMRG